MSDFEGVTKGMMVAYFPSEEENKRMKMVGNEAEWLPAMVVAVWSHECVNLLVFPDGNGGIIWKTSVQKINPALPKEMRWNFMYNV